MFGLILVWEQIDTLGPCRRRRRRPGRPVVFCADRSAAHSFLWPLIVFYGDRLANPGVGLLYSLLQRRARDLICRAEANSSLSVVVVAVWKLACVRVYSACCMAMRAG